MAPRFLLGDRTVVGLGIFVPLADIAAEGELFTITSDERVPLVGDAIVFAFFVDASDALGTEKRIVGNLLGTGEFGLGGLLALGDGRETIEETILAFELNAEPGVVLVNGDVSGNRLCTDFLEHLKDVVGDHGGLDGLPVFGLLLQFFVLSALEFFLQLDENPVNEQFDNVLFHNTVVFKVKIFYLGVCTPLSIGGGEEGGVDPPLTSTFLF